MNYHRLNDTDDGFSLHAAYENLNILFFEIWFDDMSEIIPILRFDKLSAKLSDGINIKYALDICKTLVFGDDLFVDWEQGLNNKLRNLDGETL